MHVFCKMGAHLPGTQPVWNNGFYFSLCARCGCDLVRGAHDSWRAVPKGFKVVWRPRPEGYPEWSRLRVEQETPARLLPRSMRIDPARTGLSSMLTRN